MGNFCGSCFRGAEEGILIQPDANMRRAQAAEAAERRMQQMENRGIKNPENVRRQQERQKELEDLERQAAVGGEGNLRWQAN